MRMLMWSLIGMVLATAACTSAEVVYHASFDRGQSLEGWHVFARDGKAAMQTVREANGHHLRVDHGRAASGHVPVEPGQLYSVRFRLRSERRPLFGVQYFDQRGELLPSDHHTGLADTRGWQDGLYLTRARPDAAKMAFTLYGGMAVDDLAIATATADDFVAWDAELGRAVKALSFDPPADRWERLPRTARKLRAGGELRIVMLGDSIVNDTLNSILDLRIERANPGVAVTVFPAVTNGGGCWRYRRDGHVQTMVLDHKPDLVVIGGVSHRNDIESIRVVMKEILSRSDAEVLLASGAVAAVDWMVRDRDDPRAERWRENLETANARYRKALAELAQRDRVAFFDLRDVWETYLEETGQDRTALMRDSVHANVYGQHLLGRMMRVYFTARHATSDKSDQPGNAATPSEPAKPDATVDRPNPAE